MTTLLELPHVWQGEDKSPLVEAPLHECTWYGDKHIMPNWGSSTHPGRSETTVNHFTMKRTGVFVHNMDF